MGIPQDHRRDCRSGGRDEKLLKDHRVEVCAADNLPAIRMNVSRIKEVLVQLLANAAKYSPEGSQISITAELKNRQLVTSVADRGQGIQEFEQAMIFEKFYRGQQQRERSVGSDRSKRGAGVSTLAPRRNACFAW